MTASGEVAQATVTLVGVLAGAYATWKARQGQRRSHEAKERMSAFDAADRMIRNLERDNATLRKLHQADIEDCQARIAALEAEVASLRSA